MVICVHTKLAVLVGAVVAICAAVAAQLIGGQLVIHDGVQTVVSRTPMALALIAALGGLLFGYDSAKVHTVQADARTFLRGCDGGYDVVVVDLFHGDGVPDYLITRDIFRDMKRCLAAGGVAVFNTFADLDEPRPYAHFLTTLRSELPFIVLYRPDYGLVEWRTKLIESGWGAPHWPKQWYGRGLPVHFNTVVDDEFAKDLKVQQTRFGEIIRQGNIRLE